MTEYVLTTMNPSPYCSFRKLWIKYISEIDKYKSSLKIDWVIYNYKRFYN